MKTGSLFDSCAANSGHNWQACPEKIPEPSPIQVNLPEPSLPQQPVLGEILQKFLGVWLQCGEGMQQIDLQRRVILANQAGQRFNVALARPAQFGGIGPLKTRRVRLFLRMSHLRRKLSGPSFAWRLFQDKRKRQPKRLSAQGSHPQNAGSRIIWHL